MKAQEIESAMRAVAEETPGAPIEAIETIETMRSASSVPAASLDKRALEMIRSQAASVVVVGGGAGEAAGTPAYRLEIRRPDSVTRRIPPLAKAEIRAPGTQDAVVVVDPMGVAHLPPLRPSERTTKIRVGPGRAITAPGIRFPGLRLAHRLQWPAAHLRRLRAARQMLRLHEFSLRRLL